ncbi:MAG TPA: PPC domain-containing DNA-binding protein [bacterium]|nr:PPC domain-containing DNA-binding protein [bacterium]
MIIERLRYGKDVIEEIERICREKRVKKGWVSFIGALKSAEVGYYDQKKKAYEKHTINQPVEILSGSGNVSLKEGKVFIHVHAVLSGKDGRAFGGHLFKGEIFASELFIMPLKGKLLERVSDNVTGLSLWKKS